MLRPDRFATFSRNSIMFRTPLATLLLAGSVGSGSRERGF